MIVDAHHHLWDPARADYPWLTDELAAIRRRVRRPTTSRRSSPRPGSTRRSSSRRARASTRRGSSSRPRPRPPFIARRRRLGGPDATRRRRRRSPRSARGPGGDRLVGIRHQVHDEPDPDWLLGPTSGAGIAAVGRRRPRLRPARPVARAAGRARARRGRCRSVRFVIDHLAKPPIRDGRARAVGRPARAVRRAAERLVQAVRPRHRGRLGGVAADDLAPYVDHALEVFGPERLLFGSDWPVCLLAASYERGRRRRARRCSAGADAPDEQATRLRRDRGRGLPARSADRLTEPVDRAGAGRTAGRRAGGGRRSRAGTRSAVARTLSSVMLAAYGPSPGLPARDHRRRSRRRPRRSPRRRSRSRGAGPRRGPPAARRPSRASLRVSARQLVDPVEPALELALVERREGGLAGRGERRRQAPPDLRGEPDRLAAVVAGEVGHLEPVEDRELDGLLGPGRQSSRQAS